MRSSRLPGGIAAIMLAGMLTVGAGAALARTAHSTHIRHASVGMLGTAPRTWHIIAGFSQMLPTENGNTEAVNQFYPRVLTIYPGDRVTWTVNAANEAHTVTFAPDSMLRKLEDPNNQAIPKMLNGKQVFIANPMVTFPSARGPLAQTDAGADKTFLNCGAIGPAGTPGPQSCTVTFPNLGTYSYECLFHSGIPGNPDMDGVVKVIPRPMASNRTWTVWAGTGSSTDANDGFFPARLTIKAGDSVTWKSGGVHFHTVSFGIDPLKTPLIVPVGKSAHGPILAYNPLIFNPMVPKSGLYLGGMASSGILALNGNYANLPGQVFLKAPFTLTFPKPGVYKYYCLVHGPSMMGVITVVAGTS